MNQISMWADRLSKFLQKLFTQINHMNCGVATPTQKQDVWEKGETSQKKRIFRAEIILATCGLARNVFVLQ